ncbi:hypothetical protein A0J61_09228 [Choanephora cucurbitarum]|uniref:Uncharacterized protein n=1 Tax=Choanephora cucurbitarum TaxID=101091 RepID=A0A1C7N112_9FUNG|nr:hypothetical protein A0J61_09228 [Choanephora cucurbitarum]
MFKKEPWPIIGCNSTQGQMQSAIHFNSQRKVRGRWSKEKLRFAVKTAANEKPWSQNRRLEDAWKDIADKVNGLFSDEVPLNPRVVKRCILEEARRVYSQSKSESAIDGMPADTEYEAYCCEVVKGVRFIHFCFLDNISNDTRSRKGKGRATTQEQENDCDTELTRKRLKTILPATSVMQGRSDSNVPESSTAAKESNQRKLPSSEDLYTKIVFGNGGDISNPISSSSSEKPSEQENLMIGSTERTLDRTGVNTIAFVDGMDDKINRRIDSLENKVDVLIQNQQKILNVMAIMDKNRSLESIQRSQELERISSLLHQILNKKALS